MKWIENHSGYFILFGPNSVPSAVIQRGDIGPPGVPVMVYWCETFFTAHYPVNRHGPVPSMEIAQQWVEEQIPMAMRLQELAELA